MAFILLGLGSFVIVRKLGYLDYLAMDKTVSYLKDVSDAVGLTRERRTFLNRQVAIHKSADSDDMWREVIKTLELLGIDHAEIQFNGVSFPTPPGKIHQWTAREIHDEKGFKALPKDAVLSITLPLSDDEFTYGSLHLEKDIRNDPISHYTLRRIEHLRRAIVRKTRALEELAGNPLRELVEEFTLRNGKRNYVLGEGKLTNQVYGVPVEIDKRIAFLKLASMGIHIDCLTPEQQRYLNSWEMGT